MVTKNASLNVKLPLQDKQKFEETSARLGISPSAAVRIFACKFNEYGGFPFLVQTGEPQSESVQQDLARLREELRRGTAKTYDSFDEILEEIDAEIASEQPES